MLDVLNEVFEDSPERVLCLSLNSNAQIKLSTLIKDMEALKCKVGGIEAKSWFLYTENSYYFLLGLLVLLGLEKKVIISANKQPEWIAGISSDFDAVLTDEKFQLVSVEEVDFNFNASKNEKWRPMFSGLEELSFYTSGSTGLPKKIKKPLISLINEIETLKNTFSTEISNTTFLATVSHHHIYGLLFKLLLPFLTGNKWVNEIVEYQEKIASVVNHNPAITIISSPAFLSRLDLNLASIQAAAVFSSGGPLSFDGAQKALSFFKMLPVEVYGSTETGGIAYRQQHSSNTLWQTFAGITLTDSNAGIMISSPHISEEEVLLDDMLEMHDNGAFVLKGRNDRIVNIEEKRISLVELESYLLELEWVEECIVLVISGKRTFLGCALVLSEQGRLEFAVGGSSKVITSIKESMRKRFDAVTIPKKWRVIDQVPINTQSKIDTQAILALFHKNEA